MNISKTGWLDVSEGKLSRERRRRFVSQSGYHLSLYDSDYDLGRAVPKDRLDLRNVLSLRPIADSEAGIDITYLSGNKAHRLVAWLAAVSEADQNEWLRLWCSAVTEKSLDQSLRHRRDAELTDELNHEFCDQSTATSPSKLFHNKLLSRFQRKHAHSPRYLTGCDSSTSSRSDESRREMASEAVPAVAHFHSEETIRSWRRRSEPTPSYAPPYSAFRAQSAFDVNLNVSDHQPPPPPPHRLPASKEEEDPAPASPPQPAAAPSAEISPPFTSRSPPRLTASHLACSHTPHTQSRNTSPLHRPKLGTHRSHSPLPPSSTQLERHFQLRLPPSPTPPSASFRRRQPRSVVARLPSGALVRVNLPEGTDFGHTLDFTLSVNKLAPVSSAFPVADGANPTSNRFETTLPAGSAPGEKLFAVSPTGHLLVVPLPEGSLPGLTISFTAKLPTTSQRLVYALARRRHDAHRFEIDLPSTFRPGERLRVILPDGQLIWLDAPSRATSGACLSFKYRSR